MNIFSRRQVLASFAAASASALAPFAAPGLLSAESTASPLSASARRAAADLADDRFRAFGTRSLSLHETMYSLALTSNPSNRLGPVWIIVNYFVWKGLRNFGFTEEAAEPADKTLQLLAVDLDKNGSLNEYYHPDTGAALSHHGFMDWNLLVLEMIQPAG